MQTKFCKHCWIEKPVEEFRLTRHGNPRSDCKQCELDRGKTYREQPEHRQRYLEYNRAYKGPIVRKEVSRKQCSKCGEIKPASCFSPHRHTATGLASNCKACCVLARKRYYSTPEGRAKCLAYAKSEKSRKNGELYRRTLKRLESLKRHSHTQSFKETQKRYTQSVKGKLAAIASQARRRVKLKAIGCDHLTREDIEAIFVLKGRICVYCGAKDCKLEIDHQQPIELGGDNSPDNLVPACMKCNRSKGPRYWPLRYRMK